MKPMVVVTAAVAFISFVACPEGVREFQASSGQIVSELFLPLNDIKRAENSLSEVLARFGN